VHVITGDAALGVPEDAPYDRAIITIGSLDIPPAWFSQLKLGGLLRRGGIGDVISVRDTMMNLVRRRCRWPGDLHARALHG
jgi:protein-L-isoaspartate O-methyltransferase